MYILFCLFLLILLYGQYEYECIDRFNNPDRYTLFFDNSMDNIIGLESCKRVIPVKINQSKRGYDTDNIEEFGKYLSTLPTGARNYGISEFLMHHNYINYDFQSQIPKFLIEQVISLLEKGQIENMFFDWDRTLTPFEDIMSEQPYKNKDLGENLEYMNNVWIPNYIRYKTMYDRDVIQFNDRDAIQFNDTIYTYDGTNEGKGYTYHDMALFYFGPIFEPLSRLWKEAEKNKVNVYILTANKKGGKDRKGKQTFIRLLRETGLEVKENHFYSLADYDYKYSKQDMFNDIFHLC